MRIDVIKRDGSKEPFDPKKIEGAVLKCLRSVPNWSGSKWAVISNTNKAEIAASEIAKQIVKVVKKRSLVTVEQLQDLVEIQLMNEGLHEPARQFILYREEHRKLRDRIDPADAATVRAQKVYFPTELQHFQFMDKYARFNTEKGRRETWPEAVDRVIRFFFAQGNLALLLQDTYGIWGELRDAMLKMEAMPSMRILQMAGPALERCNVGAYNCAYIPIDRLSSWSELLYVMMQGTGEGFSVESEYVDCLPRIKKQKRDGIKTLHIIPDSTEGWCEAVRLGVEAWFGGEDLDFNFSRIRPQGEILKTKGGRASGPEPLKNLLTYARTKILSRQGKRLRTIDAHDIACFCGDIVQVGGVRRAAEISLSDFDDEQMRRAKFGAFWYSEPQRQMANNSAVYTEKPSSTDFMEEFLSLAKSGSGERGIFNRAGAIPKRRKRVDFGVNPCGEVLLRPRQFCNLSIAIARPDDTVESLKRKVRIAAIFGTLQSTLTDFKYLPPEWKKNCEEERLLGVDINGQMDCPLLQPERGYGTPSDSNDSVGGRLELLEELRDLAIATNVEFAEKLCINRSAAVTCVKPSGNSSVLFNCSPGIHARFSRFYIRRVRVESFTPMAQLLKAESVPFQVGADGSYRFEFPIGTDKDAIITGDLTALEQLHNWLVWKVHFTEHNPSITVYVGADEWLQVGAWVHEHWDKVGGLSFLPRTDAVYQLAPYEAITEEEFKKRQAAFPAVDYAKLAYYEGEDHTTSAQEFACIGNVCEVA